MGKDKFYELAHSAAAAVDGRQKTDPRAISLGHRIDAVAAVTASCTVQ